MYSFKVNHESCVCHHLLVLYDGDRTEVLDVNQTTEVVSTFTNFNFCVHVFCTKNGVSVFTAAGADWEPVIRADGSVPDTFCLLAYSYGDENNKVETLTVEGQALKTTAVPVKRMTRTDREAQLVNWQQLEQALQFVEPICSVLCSVPSYFDLLRNVGVVHPSGVIADPLTILALCSREAPGQQTKPVVFDTVGRYFLPSVLSEERAGQLSWTRVLHAVLSVLVCPFPSREYLATHQESQSSFCGGKEEKKEETQTLGVPRFDFSPLFADFVSPLTAGTCTNKLVQQLSFFYTIRGEEFGSSARAEGRSVATQLSRAAKKCNPFLCEVLSPVDGPYTLLVLEDAASDERLVLDPFQFIVYPINHKRCASSSDVVAQLPSPFMSCPHTCAQLADRLNGPVLRCMDLAGGSRLCWIPVHRSSRKVCTFWELVHSSFDTDDIAREHVPVHTSSDDDLKRLRHLSCPSQPILHCTSNPSVFAGDYSRRTISACPALGLESFVAFDEATIWFDAY